MFGKRHGAPKTAANNGAKPGPGNPNERAAVADRTAPPPEVNGFLAGQIIDPYNQAPAKTYIQVVDASSPGTAPIDVPADDRGYFTIQGLQAGKQYQLIAHSQNGNLVLAGAVAAVPPDPKVLIRVSQNYTPPNLPAPAAPVAPNQAQPQPPPPSWPEKPAGGGDQAGGGAPRRAADLGPPVGIQQNPWSPPPEGNRPPAYVPPPATVVSPHPENIADRNVAQLPDKPAYIPGAGSGIIPPLPAPVPGPARVPSCQLVGRRLDNFALTDLNGQPWEYRGHPHRLVLLDFWGTWCIHCVQAIPHLKILQEQYGPYGLEVIGIAYEDGPPHEQVRKVNNVRQRKEINYQLLLGSDRDKCPVKTQFGVSQWPTLVLLDENSQIIWRHEGLGAPELRDLDVVIRQKLGVR
jgi:thiol-disulfide isomerase/thioredoxin